MELSFPAQPSPGGAPGAAAAIQPEPPSNSLRELWAAVFRSRFWIASIMGAALILAVVVTLLATRLYQASASIEVRQEAEKVLGTEADRESASSKMDTDRFLDTQLDIIRSRAVADTVAQRLGLYRGDDFLEAMKQNPNTSSSLILSPRDAHREQVLKTLADNLSVRYTGDTRIAVISFRSPDPRLAAQIANGLADAYIRNNLARKANSSSYALDFLRNQLNEAQARLAQSEREALDYARRTRIVDASNAAASAQGSNDAGRPQSLITAQLVQLNQAYSTAVAERIAAQQKWQRVAALPLMAIPDVLTNQAIQGLVQRRAQADAAYEEEIATRQEAHPSVVKAHAQVREYDQQISALARSIRNSIRSQYDVALAGERQLSGKIDALKSSTLTEQNQGIELSILRREADTNRQQYEALLRRFNELNAESGVQTNNLAIVDRAEVPVKPAWPKLSLNLVIAFILGGMLSGVFVLLREQLFNAVRTPDEVTTRLGLPLLGVVPPMEDLDRELADSKSEISDAYSSVRTSLSLVSDHGIPRSLMFTSTVQGEGKSTACHALALSLARLGKRVLIIDVDLRRPNAHRLFKLPNGKGFSNVMAGQITAAEGIVRTPNERVDLLPAGEIPPNPTELINSGALPGLLRELQERYDVVLLDSAPILGLADAVILSNRAEATLFVIESGRNPVRGIQTALSRLALGGGHVIGAILTKFDPGRMGYGYAGQYGYQYNYRSVADDE